LEKKKTPAPATPVPAATEHPNPVLKKPTVVSKKSVDCSAPEMCFSAKCYAPKEDGVCVPSPYFVETRDVKFAEELVCEVQVLPHSSGPQHCSNGLSVVLDASMVNPDTVRRLIMVTHLRQPIESIYTVLSTTNVTVHSTVGLSKTRNCLVSRLIVLVPDL
jgi:hypothetical protein